MVLCDLPYGTTANRWDVVIDFDGFWNGALSAAKENAAIVLFSQQPFTTKLIASKSRLFHYEWIWRKDIATGYLQAKKNPMKVHENILVFYRKLPTYNPQFTKGEPYIAKKGRDSSNYRQMDPGYVTVSDGRRYPVDILEFNTEKGLHPTQKPVELLRYLIRTYTNPGDVVLDPCMGSGSTGIACLMENRKFMGIEIEREYYELAGNRLATEAAQGSLFVAASDGWQVNDSLR